MDQEDAPLRFAWVRSLAVALSPNKVIRVMTIIRNTNTRRPSLV